MNQKPSVVQILKSVPKGLTSDKIGFAEPDCSDSRICDLRLPVFGPDRDPDAAWHLIGQTVECQNRCQTYHGFRCAFGNFDQGFVCVGRAVGQTVEPPTKAADFARLDRPGNRCRRDADILKIPRACRRMGLQMLKKALPLCQIMGH